MFFNRIIRCFDYALFYDSLDLSFIYYYLKTFKNINIQNVHIFQRLLMYIYIYTYII